MVNESQLIPLLLVDDMHCFGDASFTFNPVDPVNRVLLSSETQGKVQRWDPEDR